LDPPSFPSRKVPWEAARAKEKTKKDAGGEKFNTFYFNILMSLEKFQHRH